MDHDVFTEVDSDDDSAKHSLCGTSYLSSGGQSVLVQR